MLLSVIGKKVSLLMSDVRLIPRLDIKGQNVVKGIQLEGLRVVGCPQALAQKYYRQGADELLFMDIVASLYNRNNLSDIISEAAKNIFIPITVGGGIRSVDDASHLFRMGADKVAINTAAIKNPVILKDISRRFGSQSLVLSVEAKKTSEGIWEAYIDNGREKTGKAVVPWILEAQRLDIGEILLTSVDRDGTRNGFDVELIQAVATIAAVPLVVSGGMGSISDLEKLMQIKGIDAVAVASMLHYEKSSIEQLKSFLKNKEPCYA